MAHEIFGERFVGHREPAWHGLGIVSQEALTPTEAVIMARLDYTVETRPLLVDLDGMQVEIKDKIAIVRNPTDDDPEYRVYGYASPKYGLMQNTRIAELLDPLAEQWPTETVGALGHGETMFMTLDAGEQEINGDPVRQFFLITDTKDGRNALKIAFTPVRVVCQNTLTIGSRKATISASMKHHENVGNELEWRVMLLEQMQKAQKEIMASFTLMAETALTNRQAKAVIDKAYPLPKKPAKVRLAEEIKESDIAHVEGLVKNLQHTTTLHENATDRQKTYRDAAVERYEEFNDTQPNAGSSWAVYNAVVEVEDYRATRGDLDNALISALFGERARVKARAYSYAYAYVR